MVIDELPRRTHVAAEGRSVGRRQAMEDSAVEERPLSPSVSQVLARLKAAGTTEKVILQLEESERKLQSLKSEQPRIDRSRRTARSKYGCKASSGYRLSRNLSPKSAWSHNVVCQHPANQVSSRKSTSENCLGNSETNDRMVALDGYGDEFRSSGQKLASEHYLVRCEGEENRVDSHCQSALEFDPAGTPESIADAALTKSMRLLHDLKFVDHVEDAPEMELGSDDDCTGADFCVSEQISAEPTPGKPISVIEERLAQLIELLQEPNHEHSNQRSAVIDELRSLIHEHTSQPKASIDKLQSCAERMQSSVSHSASTRTPSREPSVEDLRAHCADFSCGSSASLSAFEGSALRDSGFSGTPLRQGRTAAHPPPVVRSLFADPADSPKALVPCPSDVWASRPAHLVGLYSRTASCPRYRSASPMALKASKLEHSPRRFTPRRLVCTSVKVTRTWKYE